VIQAVALLIAACGESSTAPNAERPVAAVSVSPETRQLMEGEEFTASATTLDAAGGALTGRTVSWSSSDEAVITVTQAGVVKAIAQGLAYARATSEGKKDSVAVTVVRRPVASVALDVVDVTLEEGATRQLVATPKDAAGQPLSGRGMQWTSSEPDIAQVGALGLVTAVRVGRATITVKVEGQTASATVIVSADYDFNLIYDAWSGSAGEPPQLYQVDVRHPGGMPARVFPGEPAFDGAPSPDGTRIAFVRYVSGHPQIFVGNIDGTGITRLTVSSTEDDQPAWSPDGTRIAFRRWDLTPGTGNSDIWVMNADGTEQHSLTADQGLTNQTEPAWSPRLGDGSYRIVYSSQTNEPDGEAHIWTMAANGADKRQLTSGSIYDDEPAWSPDGAMIVFQRNGVAIFGDLYLINAGGGNERRLLPVDLAFGQFAPTWSPDGRLIAFASKHEGGGTYQIYTVWADGSKLARRTFDDTNKAHPVWIRRAP
jgi:dipeptidyl aminopeptidase/acylaminoacyl peptidase